jgi:putative SOS response-associated peptidase YedK
MCGRFTYKLTWPEIVKLYRLSLDTPARNPQARHNICPTTTVDTVIGRKGLRALDALGPHTLLVIQAAQGEESRDLQRARRDDHRQPDVP